MGRNRGVANPVDYRDPYDRPRPSAVLASLRRAGLPNPLRRVARCSARHGVGCARPTAPSDPQSKASAGSLLHPAPARSGSSGHAQCPGLSAKEGLGDPAPHLATPRLDPDALESSWRLVPHSRGLLAASNPECPPFAPRVSDDHTEAVSVPSCRRRSSSPATPTDALLNQTGSTWSAGDQTCVCRTTKANGGQRPTWRVAPKPP
jgi:hypothetical protein